jgi:hypothetical protein
MSYKIPLQERLEDWLFEFRFLGTMVFCGFTLLGCVYVWGHWLTIW